MSFVEDLQRNEYLRYAHDLRRRSARAEVITGTAGLFTVSVLHAVIASRGDSPADNSYVYDNASWVEDNGLTTAVKSLGYRCASPTECTVTTELMPTVRTLYFQRLRRQRGALDTLRSYGITKTTAPYFVRQFLIHVGILFFPFFVTVVALAILETGRFPWSWPWFYFSSVVVVERLWTVREGGGQALLLASLILPEVLYDPFLHVVFVRALV
ncbi:MAG: glycosyltransferase family 2 protein, partial [Mycobacterium sp.]|nr:glycosyltransferase family 2 protein [Mycobacterium sp.]